MDVAKKANQIIKDYKLLTAKDLYNMLEEKEAAK